VIVSKSMREEENPKTMLREFVMEKLGRLMKDAS
jgi:hypothetical protein